MKYIKILVLALSIVLQLSCEDFVEIEIPDDRIINESVFNRDKTANSAVKGIYNELYQANFSGGFQTSITVLSALSADNLKATVTTENLLEFEENEIFIKNSYNLGIWSSAYNIIYMSNAVIEGLTGNNNISTELNKKLTGEARFIRAFTYYYLVNLYGEVPLVLATDYEINSRKTRNSTSEIYSQIVQDLEIAAEQLGNTYENGERLRANRFTALALLARVYLNVGEWELAETYSTEIIDASETFELLPHEEVFMANSREAIWQISPLEGGSSRSNTQEGALFILLDDPGRVALTEDLIESFESNDARLDQWIGLLETENESYYFPYKYKVKNTIDGNLEYSMVMRLAEQYLIRAEARAELGKLAESISDLNDIRQRSDLIPLDLDDPSITSDKVINLILEERRKELFTEWGHRWLDLKRKDKAGAVLSSKKPLWDDTDILYPIPEDELLKNPNLTQNSGY
ncbi:RagB/SusD family nutrient uptake outer membrane protein [Salegentibacter sp. UBA1130]|uniref:RagB/SusD family nutrient uptake outer membrane protein n=1 Tax=Salegentibacter sp. UBA1130 TaxID=1947451 RepID=UPI00257EC171|nr:RagB/SusD family nutrient uptake outer membrane protein [Salegentibacter sp. UBA1130]